MPLNTFPKSIVSDLVSVVDCFHPSLVRRVADLVVLLHHSPVLPASPQCTDEAMAVGVWNNLFQPVGQKSTTMDPLAPPQVFCPNQYNYLQ